MKFISMVPTQCQIFLLKLEIAFHDLLYHKTILVLRQCFCEY